MSGIVSHTNFDCTSAFVTIVPVIASFDSEGHITPLYVRINGESYKVDKHRIIGKYINSMEFECKVIDGDYVRTFVLTFFCRDGKWTMPK